VGAHAEGRRSTPHYGGYLIPVALAAVTVMAFLPIPGNGLVDRDDTRSFLDNPHYRGLGWTRLRWMMTASHDEPFVPLAWLTLALGYDVRGIVRLALARHEPDAPVPRLGLVRAWRILGERARVRAELEAPGRLHPGLAGVVPAGRELS
jgi:hypothetical protein